MSSLPRPYLQMTRITTYLLAPTLLFALAGPVSTTAFAEPPGQKIFVDKKCVQCHAISALKIKATKKPKKKDRKPPDLSGAGIERTAKWMTKYLLKKEKIEDRKHKKKFRGDAADLATVTKWLATLKTKPKGK